MKIEKFEKKKKKTGDRGVSITVNLDPYSGFRETDNERPRDDSSSADKVKQS